MTPPKSPRSLGYAVGLGLSLVIPAEAGGCAAPPAAAPPVVPVAAIAPTPPPPPQEGSAGSKAPPQVVIVGEGTRRYSMEELVALDRAGSHRELIAHAEDVSPAARDDAWKKLVESAALGSLAGETDAAQALGIAEELRKRFPSLGASRAFMTKRNDLAITSATTCYESRRRDGGAACTEQLHELVKTDTSEPAFAMAAGRLVIRKQFNYVAVRFFRHAIIDQPDPSRSCADPDLRRAIDAALDGLPDDDGIHKDAAVMKQVCKKR